MARVEEVSVAWERNAERWLAWARTRGHDPFRSLNLPAFLELLPSPGRLARDLGCDGVDRPLEAHTRALAEHGLTIEKLREPQPSAQDVRAAPELAVAARRPFFPHLRCRLMPAPAAR